jgi:hypothetical protein
MILSVNVYFYFFSPIFVAIKFFFIFKVIININETNETDWVIGNIKHSGFYRVNYDLNNWNLLIKQLNNENYTLIDETSRAQLIDD